MPDIECISREQLVQFLDGRLTDDQSNNVETHIDSCEACQTQVQQVQDAIAAREIPFDADQSNFAAGPQCGEALQQIRSLPLSQNQSVSEANLLSSLPKSIGPYELVKPIGQGGMGVVFLARHSELKRMVAIKLLSPLRPPTAQLIGRFEREMAAVGKLDHPHIVRASDAGEIDGMHYLVMEMVDGIDVSRLAKNTNQIKVADACEIARQAARGLQSTHEENLVHRDIKPSNLMVTRDGQVKVLDMGLALLGDFENQRELTSVGQFMGTIEYMSPEQCDNSHTVDIRGDIYSLGATLYRLLAGRPPFAKEDYKSLFKRVAAISSSDAPDIRDHRSAVPAELGAVIARMLSRDPELRYATPAKVADALTPWCDGCDLASLVASAESEAGSDSQVRVVGADGRRGISEGPSVISNSRSGKTEKAESRWWVPVLWLALGLLLLGGLIFGVSHWTQQGQSANQVETTTEESKDPRIDLANDVNNQRTSTEPSPVISSEGRINESELPMVPDLEREPSTENTSPALAVFEELSEKPDLGIKADLIRSIGGLVTEDKEVMVAEKLFDAMSNFDTFDPKQDERAIVVESIATLNSIKPIHWRAVAIDRINSGTDNQQLFAARMLHESLANDPLSPNDEQYEELSQVIDQPDSGMDVRLRAARYGLAGQMRFERAQLESQLEAESDPEARSVLAQILASRNEYSDQLVSSLGQQLSLQPNAAMPFAPADPGRAALAYLSKAPANLLPSAADNIADHFSSVVSRWGKVKKTGSDRDQRFAEQELIGVLKLLQRLGLDAKPAESALQKFRNRKLENKQLRDAAREAWTALKENH